MHIQKRVVEGAVERVVEGAVERVVGAPTPTERLAILVTLTFMEILLLGGAGFDGLCGGGMV